MLPFAASFVLGALPSSAVYRTKVNTVAAVQREMGLIPSPLFLASSRSITPPLELRIRTRFCPSYTSFSVD
jgi:hypothetical protein